MFAGATTSRAPTDLRDAPIEGRVRGRTSRGLETVLWLALFVAVGTLVWPVKLGGSSGYTVVSGKSMEPTYHTDDIVITRKHEHPAVGDVIVYRVPEGEPGAGRQVIHRIVEVTADGRFVTQGDNNPSIDPWRPGSDDLIGTAVVLAPQGARVFGWVTSPIAIGIAGATAFLWVLRPRDEDDEDDEAELETDDGRDDHDAPGRSYGVINNNNGGFKVVLTSSSLGTRHLASGG